MTEKQEQEQEKIKKNEETILNAIDQALLTELDLIYSKRYNEKIDKFKEEYHKYSQTGRFLSSTNVRKPKPRDLVAFINLETDTFIVERVQSFDGNIISTKSYEYPLSLIKTLQIRLFPLLNVNNRIVIHLAISNIESLDIANKLKELSDSVFLKNILKYGEKKALEKPITQIIIAGAVFGLVFYFVFIQVFKKAIINIAGNLTPPTE